MPISPFMDRNNGSVSASQVGFIEFLVSPLYEALAGLLEFPEMKTVCLKNLSDNKTQWKQLANNPQALSAITSGASSAAISIPRVNSRCSAESGQTVMTASSIVKELSPPGPTPLSAPRLVSLRNLHKIKS